MNRATNGRRAGTAQKDEQKGRDAKQATEERQRGRDAQKEERAQDTRKPADTRQQQTQQQHERDRKGQAESSGTTTQQSARPEDRRQGERTGQAPDQSTQRTSSTGINEDQRKQVVDRLQREKTTVNQNINVRVNVGERLPPRVLPRRLPADIVRIVPQYRDYQYTVIDNRIAIVEPRSREVVEIIDEGPGYARSAGYGRERIAFSGEERTRFREMVRSSSTTVGSTAPSGGSLASNCLSLQPVPEEMVRNHPELSSYRYLAIGDEVVLVDPEQKKIVQVID